MRNFHRLAGGINIDPLLLALYRQQHLYNVHTFRTDWEQSPHREVSDILLRLQDMQHPNADKRECVDYPAFSAFPHARALTMALMAQVEGQRLGRVMITRLPPGGQIYPHEDIGSSPLHYDHEQYYSRFHIVLQADENSLFFCGDEMCNMQPGEAWWFNNSITHSVENNSADTDRIHLIIDVRCSQFSLS